MILLTPKQVVENSGLFFNFILRLQIFEVIAAKFWQSVSYVLFVSFGVVIKFDFNDIQLG